MRADAPLVRLVAIGLLAGSSALSSASAGGLIVVPLLILVVAFPPREATATSLGAIALTALAGSIAYALRGEVHRGMRPSSAFPPWSGPSRARRSSSVSRGLAAPGLRGPARRRRRLAAALVSTTTVLIAVALGLAAGVLAGMFGVGGGILFVPALVALGLTQVEAAATSLLAVVPTVAAALVRHQSFGTVRWRAALTVGVASVIGVEIGVRIATSLPEDVLRVLFALLLLGVAAQLAWGVLGQRRGYPGGREARPPRRHRCPRLRPPGRGRGREPGSTGHPLERFRCQRHGPGAVGRRRRRGGGAAGRVGSGRRVRVPRRRERRVRAVRIGERRGAVGHLGQCAGDCRRPRGLALRGRDHGGVRRRAGDGGGRGRERFADVASSSVNGLVVLGQPISATPGSQIPLVDWGVLDVLGQTTESTDAAPRRSRAVVTGLRVRVNLDHGGVPAGSEIVIAGAEAVAQATPAPAPEPAPRPVAPLPRDRADGRPAVARPSPPQEPGRSLPGVPDDLVRDVPEGVLPRESGGGYVFPVYGPVSFGDSFAGPRSALVGGWHHGEDLFAPLGTPLLAVADGTVFSVGWNDLGGWRLWLRDRRGNQFYYAHLSAYSPLAGQRPRGAGRRRARLHGAFRRRGAFPAASPLRDPSGLTAAPRLRRRDRSVPVSARLAAGRGHLLRRRSRLHTCPWHARRRGASRGRDAARGLRHLACQWARARRAGTSARRPRRRRGDARGPRTLTSERGRGPACRGSATHNPPGAI